MKIKEVIPKKINLDNNKANVYNYVKKRVLLYYPGTLTEFFRRENVLS